MQRKKPCDDTETTNGVSREYIINGYLEDLGILTELSSTQRLDIKPDYGVYKTKPYVIAIHNRLSRIWSWGRGCPTTLGDDNTIYWTVKGGRGADGALQDIAIPEHVSQQIRAMQNCKVKVAFIPLCWMWISPRRDFIAHSTLLVVDNHSKTYSLFDPYGGQMAVADDSSLQTNALNLNRYDLLRDCPPLFVGYLPFDRRQPHPSLQTAIERCHIPSANVANLVSGGMCALLSTLVLVFCYRFQSHDPWDIATGIRDNFNGLNQTQKELFRINLHNWYTSLYTANSWAQLHMRVGLLNPRPKKDRRCLVYGRKLQRDGSKRNCLNASTKNAAYCSFHTQMLLTEQWGRKYKTHMDDALPLAVWSGGENKRKKK